MKVKCKLKIPSRGVVRREIIEVPDHELAGLREEEVIDVINRYFEKWMSHNIDAEWEIED